MARPPEDAADRACAVWSAQWVRAYAKPPERAGDYVGPLSCTLGRVVERHDGAASSTERDRHWPEFPFMGDGLVISCVLKSMPESHRQLVWHHYIGRWYRPPTWVKQQRPVRQQYAAERMGLSLRDYYDCRDAAKSTILSVLSLDLGQIFRERLEAEKRLAFSLSHLAQSAQVE